MNIWTVPTPVVFGLMALVLYVGLFGMKIQKIAYNLGTQFATQSGSGVSKPSLNSFCTLVTPTWVRAAGWVSTFLALLMLIYVGMRFGWLWAVAYVAGDHYVEDVRISHPANRSSRLLAHPESSLQEGPGHGRPDIGISRRLCPRGSG